MSEATFRNGDAERTSNAGRFASKTVIYLLLIAWAIVCLFPIYWTITTSFKTAANVMKGSLIPWWDYTPAWLGWRSLGLSPETIGAESTVRDEFMKRFFNSAITAISSSSIAVVLGSLAAYGLSRFRFGAQQHFMFFVLAQRMMPPIAVAIPLFFIFRDIGLRDTHLGLILAHTLINLPLAVLLMKSFFDDVPVELDEAATIDGAGRVQTFARVVLPLVKGGLAATAVLCFIFSWTEFLISLQLTTSIRTIPVKISTFVTSTGTEWGFITALGSAALIPSFIFIMLVQRHLVRGLTLGSLKD